MMEYLAHRIEINANHGTVATITADEYLVTVNKYIPDIEIILKHFTKMLEDNNAAGIKYAQETLDDYDTIVSIIQDRDVRWWKNHLKNTKEWLKWKEDIVFNDDKWFWQKSRTVGEEPRPGVYMSENVMKDKIQDLKNVLDVRYVRNERHYYNDDSSENIINFLYGKHYNMATERIKEDAERNLYFLEEIKDTTLAAKYSTIYVPNDAMVRLATVEKFIAEKLEEMGK